MGGGGIIRNGMEQIVERDENDMRERVVILARWQWQGLEQNENTIMIMHE